MFDLGRHISYGSNLFRILARKFGVVGRSNDIVAGVYHKTLTNPAPDPFTHITNFCLKIKSNGKSQLQDSLCVFGNTLSANDLLGIYLAAVNGSHVSLTATMEQSKIETNPAPAKKSEEESPAENTIPNCDIEKSSKRNPLRTAMSKLEHTMCKLIDNLERNDGWKESTQRTSRTTVEHSRAPEQNRPTPISKETVQTVKHKTVEQNCSKPFNNGIAKSLAIPPAPVQPIKQSSTLFANKKQSRDDRSNSGTIRKNKHARFDYYVDPSNVGVNYNHLLISDFGGDLSQCPQGSESYEDYDSDYFEKERSALSRSSIKKKKTNLCSSRQVAEESNSGSNSKNDGRRNKI
jgi:hypothetical protein